VRRKDRETCSTGIQGLQPELGLTCREVPVHMWSVDVSIRTHLRHCWRLVEDLETKQLIVSPLRDPLPRDPSREVARADGTNVVSRKVRAFRVSKSEPAHQEPPGQQLAETAGQS